MENELQCIICSELFIEVGPCVRLLFSYSTEGGAGRGGAYGRGWRCSSFPLSNLLHSFPGQAVTLGCAHSFCHYCIGQWRKRRDECPICRQPIQSQTRCLALDNCIDSMVENLSADVKARRRKLTTERKGERCVCRLVTLAYLPPCERLPSQLGEKLQLGLQR